MASLPPKPQGSPSRDAPKRFQDERDRRSRHSPHRVDEGTHSRRWVSGGDSYAPAYDIRRENEYYWRDTENRTRRSWNRQPDLDARFGRGPPDYDRDREYERRDYYVPNPRYRDSYGRRDQQRWRSRSPGRWDRNRSRSPYGHRVRLGNHSVDTSPRRSPRRPSRYSRSRSRDVSRRLRSRSPRPEPAVFSNTVKTEEGAVPYPTVIQDKGLPQTTMTTRDSYQDKSGIVPPSQGVSFKKEEKVEGEIPAAEEAEIKTAFHVVKDEPLKGFTNEVADQYPTKSHSPTLSTHLPEKKHTINLPSHLEGPQSDKQIREHEKSEEEKLSLPPSQHRARSPSPSRQFHHRGPPGPSYSRHRSRSPPKGPRNQSSANTRGHITPTGPASSHAPGPWGQRRSFAPQNSLSNTLPRPPTPHAQSPVIPSVSAPTEDVKLTTVQVIETVKLPLPAIPIKQVPPSLTGNLDNEIFRLQLQRARLATDHANLAKEIRRAMHELDTATIDLHAAALRRKVADVQHQKARYGLLGVDYIPTGETRF